MKRCVFNKCLPSNAKIRTSFVVQKVKGSGWYFGYFVEHRSLDIVILLEI